MGDIFREPVILDCVASKKPAVRIEYDSAVEHQDYQGKGFKLIPHENCVTALRKAICKFKNTEEVGRYVSYRKCRVNGFMSVS